MIEHNIVIIGGGPAGLAAAVAAYDAGVTDVVILERENTLGGILRQCIHPGFGLHRFGEELTGPEYAARFITEVKRRGIRSYTGTFVTEITPDRVVTAQNADGCFQIKAGAVVLAMGCRERPRGALNIPGTRPAGIYSAGTAQRLVNLDGYMPGRRVVILGSGDIGLIMARRMTLEGAKVLAVCELLPYSGGLARNIEQCLNDYNIPLLLSHTVTVIRGQTRLTGVTISEVDENRRPIPGTEQEIECDTLLLSVGLIPENELSKTAGVRLDRATSGAVVDDLRMTETEGIFSCGNVLHVHDLADYVSSEAEIAGAGAAAFVKGLLPKVGTISVKAGAGVRYTVPQRIRAGDGADVYFRTTEVTRGSTLRVCEGDNIIYKRQLRRAAPGEMQSVKLSAAMLAAVTEGITIELEKKV